MGSTTNPSAASSAGWDTFQPAKSPSIAPLTVAACAAAVLLFIPLLAIVYLAFTGNADDWPHLIRFVIPHSVGVTLHTLLATLGLAALLGVSTAWLVAVCHFPGRRMLEWALILPLAVPPYVSTYYYVELFSFSGPLQSALRTVFGWSSAQDYWFPSLSNPWGASFLFAFVLYPYVYLTTRVLFTYQARSVLESARSLGAGPWEVFYRVALPIARPAIVIGLSLVAMETLNDIGAVDYLGVDMLALAVFDTWLNRGSLSGAAQIALTLLAFIVLVLWAEHRARKANTMVGKNTLTHAGPLYVLKGARAALAFATCAVPVLLGFLIPLVLLVQSTILTWDDIDGMVLLTAGWHSILIASSAAFMCFVIAIVLVGGARQTQSLLARGIVRTGVLGYAVPGTILGVGTLIAFASFDNWLDGQLRSIFNFSSGLLLTGSILGLVFACSVRFMAMTQGSMSSAMDQVPVRVDHAARTLGQTRWGVFRLVHLPMLAKAGLAGSLLVFVDTLKELSATLVLIPFNFGTLSTFLYEKASNAQVEEGSVAALVIVLVGLLPVVYVSQSLSRHSSNN